MNHNTEGERKENGRGIADAADMPGVLAYGAIAEEARQRLRLLTLTLSL